MARLAKPYHEVTIQDCGEPLVALPPGEFARVSPHPYEALGAPYGDRSPFFVRTDILRRLRLAQAQLRHWGWKLQIFDAYRPIAVQQFMVDYTFEQERQKLDVARDALSPIELKNLWARVHQFWAIPSSDPATPPPHSTGAAVDVTLVDANEMPVNLGSPIDEISERSYPEHFAESAATDSAARAYHQRRTALRKAMAVAGFIQHPNEWWHFSHGDQMWGWLCRQSAGTTGGEQKTNQIIARYGAVE